MKAFYLAGYVYYWAFYLSEAIVDGFFFLFLYVDFACNFVAHFQLLAQHTLKCVDIDYSLPGSCLSMELHFSNPGCENSFQVPLVFISTLVIMEEFPSNEGKTNWFLTCSLPPSCGYLAAKESAHTSATRTLQDD